MGAMGKNVCMGNNCTSTSPANYGRYAVITPSTSLASLMAAGKQLTAKFGEQEIAGFVDDVSGAPAPYVYATFSSVREGRAQLDGGSAPLTFQKWDGQGFNTPGIGGAEPAVIPTGAFQNCEAPSQSQFGSSISYVEDAQQYVLTFVCISFQDPALGIGGTGNQGAAWFYSTSYDLSDPLQWSAPKEIAGSWSQFDNSGGCPSYNGYYPTFMSLGKKPGICPPAAMFSICGDARAEARRVKGGNSPRDSSPLLWVRRGRRSLRDRSPMGRRMPAEAWCRDRGLKSRGWG